MSSNHDLNADTANVRYLNSRRVDAILVSPSGEDDPTSSPRWPNSTAPSSPSKANSAGRPPVDAVCADHRSGMREAVEYLIGRGHRRIAALTGHHSPLRA